MFKTWQIFVFSLIPLALVFMGVIGGSFHGVDSAQEEFLPPAISTPTGSGGSGGGAAGGGGGATLTVAAKDLQFSPRSLTAPPNQSVTVILANGDVGILHNFAVYRDNRYTTNIFRGNLVAGEARQNNTFTTPGAGTYYFRCDAHPDTMTGTFTVR